MQSYLKKDLDEDVVITLVAKNPQAPHNKIRYDHTTGTYITQKLAETMIDHLEIESLCVHKDSEEGRKQLRATEDTPEDAGINVLFFINITYVRIHYMVVMFHGI